MRLVDHVAQCKLSILAAGLTPDCRTRLSGAADHAAQVAQCESRYILTDELTRLCAALAYSKGARALECVDLIRVPAERVWIEWNQAPWIEELKGFGFRVEENRAGASRCRGALILASRDGKRGNIRTFWDATDCKPNVHASSMLAEFNLDDSTEPTGMVESGSHSGLSPMGALCVSGDAQAGPDLIARCFRFQFERTWGEYYERANLARDERIALTHHCLGTIAPDIPLLLAFFLLLATRGGLSQNLVNRGRLNRIRQRDGRPSLLDHIEVSTPIIPYGSRQPFAADAGGRASRERRLHAVRGHLVRRGSSVFWRVPHLRGSARWGVVRSRTVTWQFDDRRAGSSEAIAAVEAFAQ
jgi:hypothetical protein